MMKKITLKITLFLAFGLMVFSVSAQTTYYEDFRYENEGRGFTVQKVALGGQLAASIGKRVGDVPDAADSGGLFVSRPANRIPNGGTRAQRAISTVCYSGDPIDTNHEIEAWILMTTQDLTSVAQPEVSFWTEQRFAVGGISTLKIMVSTNYVHGALPSTAVWADETSNITGKIATSGVDPETYVQGGLDLASYSGSTTVTVAFKVESSSVPYTATEANGSFLISDVDFKAAPQDVADGAFSALNTSATGQTAIFNTPSAAIDDANFSNTSKWADVLTAATSVPRLANGVLIPIGEGYKFEVSGAYNPIAVSEVRYVLANGTSNKGAPDESKWIVQGSNDDSTWDNLSVPVGMFSGNSGAGNEQPITLSTSQAYRYYRFVLSTAWTPNAAYTALQQLDFTVNSATASVEDDVLTQGLSIYPNPVSNLLNIKIIDAAVQVKRVDLMDVMGKVIYSNNKANPINVSGFAKGIYLLRVSSENGGVLSKKVIVN